MQRPQNWVGILRKCVVGPFIVACGNLNWDKYLNLFQNDISSATKYCIVQETYKTVLHLTNFYNLDIFYTSSFLKVRGSRPEHRIFPTNLSVREHVVQSKADV